MISVYVFFFFFVVLFWTAWQINLFPFIFLNNSLKIILCLKEIKQNKENKTVWVLAVLEKMTA